MNTRTKTYVVSVMLAVALMGGIVLGVWVLAYHPTWFFGGFAALIVLGAATNFFLTILRARGWK